MKHLQKVRKFFGVTVIGLLLQLALPADTHAQFFDDFLPAEPLDPAWTVVQTWPGGAPRIYGYTDPGNHYSLTDNPGYLRYGLDPMTHHEGFVNGYATVPPWYYSCCAHDAGLEIDRAFSGNYWTFEVGALYHLPSTNGRSFIVRLYFNLAGVPDYWVALTRGADTNQNYANLILTEKTGPALGDQINLEVFAPGGGWYYGAYTYPSPAPLYFRVERAGGLLTASWSDDGLAWTEAWSHDLGAALDGLDQHVTLAGLSWFNTGGSYADYDYVALVPTVIPVDIDITPGIAPNLINPTKSGVTSVAILTDVYFDATTVDPLSVEFGPDGATESHGRGHLKDVDGDLDLDMVLHFKTTQTGIQCGDTEASLTGVTTGGDDLSGTDAILTVNC